MKKEMFKKLKAVILSVFMLGIVLFQCADAMPVMASGNTDVLPKRVKNQMSLSEAVKEINSGFNLATPITEKDYFIYYVEGNTKHVVSYRADSDVKQDFLPVPYIKCTDDSYSSQLRIHLLFSQSVCDTGSFSFKYLSSGTVAPYDFEPKKTTNVSGKRSSFFEDSFHPKYEYEIRPFNADKLVGFHVLYSSFPALVYDDTAGNTYLFDYKNGGSSGSSGSYDESNASYKRNLGYLQGMSKKTIMLYGENASQDTNSAKYKFSYSKTSNSGFDLTQDDVYIRLYAQVAVYDKHGKGENIMVNMPKTFVGQYKASPLSLTVSAMDIFNANSDVWSQINTTSWQWKTVLHGYQRMDKLYFQIVAKNPDGTWSYGGYTTLNDKVSSNGAQVTVVGTQTPDGGKDIDYAYNENISSSAGVGSTYKDAEANADANASGDGGFKLTGFNGLVEIFNSFKDGLSSFTYAFGNFPELIAKTFPFLPAFITSAISLGFLVAVVLRLLGR